MMQFLLFSIVGGLFAFFFPSGHLFGDANYVNVSTAVSTAKWFVIGGFLSTAVRFVAPKREHIITLLGTIVIQSLKTGIRLTLPWPLGWTHSIVHTDVRSKKVKVQIKSKDNLVFLLPVTIQSKVIDATRYAIERDNPDQQMENLTVAAVRAAGNAMEFQAIFDDKQHVKAEADKGIGDQLKSFGLEIVELVVEDPELPESIAKALNSIREAEYDRQAAINQAHATYERMVGEARAEAESTRLKGIALSGFRMQIAEGNAAAIAVMQGKLAVVWEDKTIGEGENAKTVKVAKFVKPESVKNTHGEIPEVEIDPRTILEFFKVVDSNDAIRDAASKPGTVIVAPAGGSGGSDFAHIAAMIHGLGSTSEHKAA